jgi:hypothetical protein
MSFDSYSPSSSRSGRWVPFHDHDDADATPTLITDTFLEP